MEEKYRQAFIAFDRDGDGEINAAQAQSALQSCGIILSKEEAGTISTSYSMQQFQDLVGNILKKKSPEAELKNLFKMFDHKKDGTISTQELKQVLCTLGDQLSDGEIEQLLRDFDSTNSGKSDYAAICQQLTK